MKKMIVAAVAAASLSGGALAFGALAPIGMVSAHEAEQPQAAARERVEHRVASRRGEIAEYLGLTPEALRQELKAGKTLAEIAGPKAEGLVDLLTAKAQTRIEAALATGKIDEARAATLKEKAGRAVERLVNAKRPAGTAVRPG